MNDIYKEVEENANLMMFYFDTLKEIYEKNSEIHQYLEKIIYKIVEHLLVLLMIYLMILQK